MQKHYDDLRCSDLCSDLFSTYLRFRVVFFTPRAAYEMRISDWSSDVCSSDLLVAHVAGRGNFRCIDLPRPAGAARRRRLLRRGALENDLRQRVPGTTL